jgi:KAP family P-loop domain
MSDNAVAAVAMPLRDDNPSDIDLLGFEDMVDVLEEIVTRADLDPVTVGVNAPWGGGKTTVLQLLKRRLDPRDDVFCLLVSPWEYDNKTGPTTALIDEVKFMREKLEEAGALGSGEAVRTKSFAEKGVGISPAFTQIDVSASRTFTVRGSRDLGLPAGTVVKVTLSKSAGRALEVVGQPVDLEPDPLHDDLLRGSFTLRGVAVSGTVQVGCQVDSLDPVYAEVQVVEPGPVQVEIADGFAFQRKNYTVRPGARKKLVIRARFDRPVAEPPSVSYTVADPSVIALRQRTPLELVEGTTYYEGSVLVEGKRLNSKTTINASLDGRTTNCGISVVPREEEGIELTFQLVDYPIGKSYRATWDRDEPNKLLITTTHESIRRYLGDEAAGYPGQHSEAFRVLLAELISDNVCRRIVQEHARALPMEFDSDKVYQLHNRFMREFTPIAHRIQLASPST